jgi:Ran GTPase-activating protein (RanGAP) involved in mRNA processing and transport
MKITLTASTGKRSRVDPEKARAIVQTWKRQIKTYQKLAAAEVDDDDNNNNSSGGTTISVYKLDVSCLVWPRESIDVLSPFLRQHVIPSVVIVQLSDTVASLNTDDGLSSYQAWADLFCQAPLMRHLYLADNAAGTRAFDLWQPWLSRQPLHTLSLYNCGISAECGPMLRNILTHPEQLQVLDLGRNQFGIEGARVLGQILPSCVQLRHLGYAGSRPLVEGTQCLVQGLVELVQKSQSLQVLEMDDCFFRSGSDESDPVHGLVRVLEKVPHLTRLGLADSELEEEGLYLVLSALEKSKARLTYLNLSHLSMGVKGAERLGRFIETTQQYSTLLELHLENNELGAQGMAHVLTPFLQSEKYPLQVLHLADNQLTQCSTRWILDARFAHLLYLDVTENTDLTPSSVAQLQEYYISATIKADDDLEENDDDDDDDMEDDAVSEDDNEKSKDAGDDDGLDGLPNALNAARI